MMKLTVSRERWMLSTESFLSIQQTRPSLEAVMTSPEARDRRVMQLYEQLLEIEQRLIPTGLHIFGRPSQASERAGMLKMIASFPRPESGTRGLPELVAEGICTLPLHDALDRPPV